MSDSYFVSDLHLTRDSRDRSEAFIALCARLAEQGAARLFLLGDIFHYWLKAEQICLRDFASVLNALRALSGTGTEIHYFIGNHDFLFRFPSDWRDSFALYPRGTIFTLGRRRFYICHGDELCRADWGYRLTNPILRSRVTEAAFSLLPEQVQERIARFLTQKSREMVQKKPKATLRASLPYCRRLIERHQVEGIIHGHVHKNAFQTIEIARGSAVILSVGPWTDGERPVWRYRDEEDRWELVE